MDLGTLFTTSSTKSTEAIADQDLIVSDDSEFIENIADMYAIEGYSQPLSATSLEVALDMVRAGKKIRHFLLDNRQPMELKARVTEATTSLDVGVNVIVISSLDSIKMQNWVEAQGASYMLWDGKVDDLLWFVSSNPEQACVTTQTKSRVAKRVLVLGTRGGIGVSTISCALSYLLATQANLKTLLIDHDTCAVVGDMLLGLKGLKLRMNSHDLSVREMDAGIARTYLHNVSEKIDYLVMESSYSCIGKHSETLTVLSQQLVSEYNFMIDSVSSGQFDEIHDGDLRKKYHKIIVVCDPSIVSLRAYKLLKRKLGDAEHQVIFNHSRPLSDYPMSISSAEKRMKMENTVSIGFEPGLEKGVIQKGDLHFKKSKFMKEVDPLLTALTGKKSKNKKNFWPFKK
ncbi:hypothetical protein BIT28_04460 [Photobacterium proteolyticum]|uniref:ArsA/GET3 Anion-transporting ATPase-like domain-containing protein n=1 Tax=Photobacterium proteolyticum TaxID=1903952 RepID=A0A1Q9H1Q8_9GAMM|nr:ArsA-related P-loop ATPase [Photobacterium proteolyticum]OLQ81639.1 hypothetical protein BIT28_04460 [Photobacterium proteolyticum]